MTLGGRLYPLPTPERRTAGSGYSSPRGLLPTPAAGNFNDGESPESWEARRQANLAKKINGNGQGTPLAIAVQLLPTPTAGDAKASGSRNLPGSKAHLGVSLTDLVQKGNSVTPRKSGGLTDPLSAAGSPSPAAPLPGQLSLDGTGNA
jgi:hypothetical protein